MQLPFTELNLMLADAPRLVEQGKTATEKEFESDEELIEYMMKWGNKQKALSNRLIAYGIKQGEMFLEITELKTHAYDYELQAIIQGDETIALASIDTAIEFAKSKLMKAYDVEAIFSTTGGDRNPLLLKIVKDIAVWELIGLANPSVDYADKKYRYEQAVDWLTAVYKGMPANLPVKVEADKSNSKSFSLHSNPKRANYF